MSKEKYRLVTRSDFDGLVCAMLLRELDILDEIKFVHPKDMQDGLVAIGPRDIVTNLPYVAGCHLTFDHHASETERLGDEDRADHVIDPDAPSAARVVYDYYGGAKTFPKIGTDLMAAVDQADSAQFSREEIFDPTGWVLMNFLMDSRTGLGRFRSFRISNYDLMMKLVDTCRDMPVAEVLKLPDVAERVDLYMEHRTLFRAQVERCARVHDNLVVLDLRDEDVIYAGNRFMIYALFPQCDVSMHVMWGVKQQNTVFAIGKSIIDRSAKADVGSLCLSYGGGGHEAAGTCQVANDQAERVKAELIGKLSPMRRAA